MAMNNTLDTERRNSTDSNDVTVGSNTTTRSRRSSTSSSLSTLTDTTYSSDGNVNVLGEALKPIIDYLARERRSYSYQIFEKPKLLYDCIGTITQLLQLNSEGDLYSMLGSLGLCRKTKQGYGLQMRKWEVLSNNVNGCSFLSRYGKDKQHILTLGIEESIANQVKREEEPPEIPSEIIEVAIGILNNNRSLQSGDAQLPPIETIELERKLPNGRRKYKSRTRTSYYCVNGQLVQVDNLHNRLKCVEKNRLRKQEAALNTVNGIRQVAKKKRIDLDIKNVLRVGCFASRFPQLGDVNMEQALAMGALIFSTTMGLTDPTMDNDMINFDSIVTIAPSRTTIKNHVKTVAAHKIIINGRRMMQARKVFIGTDHGGGVLVKMAFFWDITERKIVSLNLDFDKAGHDAKAGGKAIKQSIKKYSLCSDQPIKFSGGSSDSGGGFTKAAMKRALITEGLADNDTYLHVNCTDHNDQTALRSACTKVYGTGAIDNRNVLQFIHSFADLQKAHESTVQFKDRMNSEYLFIRQQQAPNEFLKLMQEPILTRWKTVGEATQFIYKYRDVLVSLGESLCKMKGTTSNSQIGKCAANFLSLAKEEELVVDVAFLAAFDEEYFINHMEFNQYTDENIGLSGFIPHHHLVRYFVKVTELETLQQELSIGSIDVIPENPKLKGFWDELNRCKSDAALKKARLFVEKFLKSVHKHNAQFISSELLFLACFGEHNTATIVAKLFFPENNQGHEEMQGDGDGLFESPFHKKTINLKLFESFVNRYCRGVIPAAKQTENFKLVEHSIQAVANGRDIWYNHPLMEPHKMFYLENFAALPSTSIWVERAVKKAKLCQQTGNNERNVTAYCIAGDGLYDKCLASSTVSGYEGRMSKKRKLRQDLAAQNGTDVRCKSNYKEDLTRGPSLLKNINDHAALLYRNIMEVKADIGDEAYGIIFAQTYDMLTKLSLQGSFARYQEELATLHASRQKMHVPFARERVRGVDKTALLRNKLDFGSLRAADNMLQMKTECASRGISTTCEVTGKVIGWRLMIRAIQAQEKDAWIANNPGKTPPLELKQSFSPRSGANFIEKE